MPGAVAQQSNERMQEGQRQRHGDDQHSKGHKQRCDGSSNSKAFGVVEVTAVATHQGGGAVHHAAVRQGRNGGSGDLAQLRDKSRDEHVWPVRSWPVKVRESELVSGVRCRREAYRRI